jgi:cytochrome c556
MKRVALLAGAALLATGLVAMAQESGVRPDTAIKYRKGVFTAMNWQMRVMGTMIKTGKIDKAAFAQRAQSLEALVNLPYEAFTPGTEKGDTRALEGVFTDRARFDELARRMQGEVTRLAQVARGGDEAAIRTQFGAVDKACEACHDDYRRK